MSTLVNVVQDCKGSWMNVIVADMFGIIGMRQLYNLILYNE
jgi:hypothetical protein